MGPLSVGILAIEVVILPRMHDEGNLAAANGAFGLECGPLDRWIII
jgi:hypothetical protein